MNKERMLGVFNNLLLEVQEAEMIDHHGICEIMNTISNHIKDSK